MYSIEQIPDDQNHFRLEPITNRIVLIIPSSEKDIKRLIRNWRANQQLIPTSIHQEWCFCCPDHPQFTNQDIGRVKTTKSGRVRVTTSRDLKVKVDNKKPKNVGHGLYSKKQAFGTDEVVIMGDDHSQTLSSIPGELLTEVLLTCRDRFLDLRGNNFLNHTVWSHVGNELFTDQDNRILDYEHPQIHIISRAHTQKRVEEEIANCVNFSLRQGKERCQFCDLIRQEIEEEDRIIFSTDHFLAFIPYAARHPFETWIMPVAHEPYYERIINLDKINDYGYYQELAGIIKKVLRALEKVLGPRFIYSLNLHNTPLHDRTLKNEDLFNFYHWRLRLKPFLIQKTHNEDANDESINPIPPNFSVQLLRQPPEEIADWLTIK